MRTDEGGAARAREVVEAWNRSYPQPLLAPSILDSLAAAVATFADAERQRAHLVERGDAGARGLSPERYHQLVEWSRATPRGRWVDANPVTLGENYAEALRDALTALETAQDCIMAMLQHDAHASNDDYPSMADHEAAVVRIRASQDAALGSRRRSVIQAPARERSERDAEVAAARQEAETLRRKGESLCNHYGDALMRIQGLREALIDTAHRLRLVFRDNVPMHEKDAQHHEVLAIADEAQQQAERTPGSRGEARSVEIPLDCEHVTERQGICTPCLRVALSASSTSGDPASPELAQVRAALGAAQEALTLAIPYVVMDEDPCWCALHDAAVSQWELPCSGCRVRAALAASPTPPPPLER